MSQTGPGDPSGLTRWPDQWQHLSRIRIRSRRGLSGEDRQVRDRQRGRSWQHRHGLSVARSLLRARRRDQGLQPRRRRRRGEGAHRAQDVPVRSAHGRHAAASAHPADLRRRRGGDYCYIVTEHVHGARTLAAYCKPDNLLRIDDVVEIVYKCAKALHYAHSRGVIHRDIKPSNIMLTQESDVRIIDFGIALVADSDISRIEGIAGSPSLHVARAGAEPRAHQPLRPVFARRRDVRTADRCAAVPAGNLAKLLHQIVYATPAPVHTLRPDIPEELEDVVATALHEGAGARYKTRPRLRRRPDARAPEAARGLRSRWTSRSSSRAAAAALLPRFLAGRDLGGHARQHLAGLRAGEKSCAKARWTTASTSSSPVNAA
jgi:hypothetical protein